MTHPIGYGFPISSTAAGTAETFDIQGTHLFGIQAQPQNTTYYIGENGLVGAGANTGSLTEADSTWLPIVPVKLKDLYVTCNPAPASGQTCTVTIRKNGADTSLAAIITSAGGVFSDTADSVTAGPGDTISFKSVTSATSGAVAVSGSVRFVDPYTDKGISIIPFSSLAAAGDQACYGIGGVAGLASGEPHTFPIAHSNAYITNFFDQASTSVHQGISVNEALGSYRAVLANGTASLSTTANAAFLPLKVPLIASSFYRPTILADAAVVHKGAWQIKQLAEAAEYEIKPFYFTSRQQAQNTTRYMSGHGCTGDATEADVQFPISSGTLKNFILYSETAVPAGQTWTATVRLDGASALSLVITGTDVVAVDTTSTVRVTDGQKISVQLTSSATTGTEDLQFACDHMT